MSRLRLIITPTLMTVPGPLPSQRLDVRPARHPLSPRHLVALVAVRCRCGSCSQCAWGLRGSRRCHRFRWSTSGWPVSEPAGGGRRAFAVGSACTPAARRSPAGLAKPCSTGPLPINSGSRSDSRLSQQVNRNGPRSGAEQRSSGPTFTWPWPPPRTGSQLLHSSGPSATRWLPPLCGTAHAETLPSRVAPRTSLVPRHPLPNPSRASQRQRDGHARRTQVGNGPPRPGAAARCS